VRYCLFVVKPSVSFWWAGAFGALGGLVLSCDTLGRAGDATGPGSMGECTVVTPCSLEGVAEAVPCERAEDCPEGLQCDDVRLTQRFAGSCTWPGYCVPYCECVGGDVCNSSGQCRPTPCDEPGGSVCPAHFRCDPAAVADDAGFAHGSVVVDSVTLERAHAAGCVRRRCNEPDGYLCDPRYACEPTEASDVTGCVPLPCEETGLCSDDRYYACMPSGSHPRLLLDDFGCVERNCDDQGFYCDRTLEIVEGVGAVFVSRVCDFSSPLADSRGCVSVRCDEPGPGCESGFVCEPGSSEAKTTSGCRFAHCPDEYTCPDDRQCEPSSSRADSHGCQLARNSGSGSGGGPTGCGTL
jgi:hypothetical protein